MTERPIIFSGANVCSVRAGDKTHTRRVIRWSQKSIEHDGCTLLEQGDGTMWPYNCSDGNESPLASPYGLPGDQLWVRETWADVNSEEGPAILYRADGGMASWHEWCVDRGPDYGAGPSMNYDAYPGDYVMWWSDLWNGEPEHSWKSPIYMPRWASRLTLKVIDVRAEKVQDISLDDAAAEGCEGTDGEPSLHGPVDEIGVFAALWDSINAKRGFGWDVNPWVWVVEFKRVEATP